MKATKFTTIGFASALIATSSAFSATNLVTNGDFEADAGAFVVWPGYIQDGAPGNNPAAITGWTKSGGGGAGLNPSGPPDHPAPSPFAGANTWNTSTFAFLQGDPGLEQTIPGFLVGTEYTLSFDFNSRTGAAYPIAEVFLNDVLIASSEAITPGGLLPIQDNPTPGANPADTPWYHVDLPFNAPTEAITLRFQGSLPPGGGDVTWTIDNVVINDIPEPATGILALIGATALLGLRRRRS